jgi:hypothetical protein
MCQRTSVFLVVGLLLGLTAAPARAAGTGHFQKGDARRICNGFTRESIQERSRSTTEFKASGKWNAAIDASVQIIATTPFGTKFFIENLIASDWTKNPNNMGEPVYANRFRLINQRRNLDAWVVYRQRFAVLIRATGNVASYDDLVPVWRALYKNVRVLIDLRYSEETEGKPFIALDRTDGAPGAPLRLTEHRGFKPRVGTEILWDNQVLEDHVRVKEDGTILAIPGRIDLEVRRPPWLWLFIPRDATPGDHTLQIVQEDAHLKSNIVTVSVRHLSRQDLAKDFDALLRLYKEQVPRNPQSTNGRWWNISHAFAGPNFKCGDYQSRVIRFCMGVLFSEDVRTRRLMDGFDFGPLMSGADVIRFTHHFVVIYPKGRDWHMSGVFLDPWPSQSPRAYVVNPRFSDAWWQDCKLYEGTKEDGFFVDRSAYADFLVTQRADKLVYGGQKGMFFPTHSDGGFNYKDLIHEEGAGVK